MQGCQIGHLAEVGDEGVIFSRADRLVLQPQQVGWMNGDTQVRPNVEPQPRAADGTDFQIPTGQGPGGGRTQRHNGLRPDNCHLPLKPAQARPDFRHARLLMQATFAALKKFEVLDRIGDVNGPAVQSGIAQRPVEEQPRRSNEGLASNVLLVAGLLPNEHQGCRNRSFAEHGLRSGSVERASPATGGLGPQGFDRAHRLTDIHVFFLLLLLPSSRSLPGQRRANSDRCGRPTAVRDNDGV